MLYMILLYAAHAHTHPRKHIHTDAHARLHTHTHKLMLTKIAMHVYCKVDMNQL